MYVEARPKNGFFAALHCRATTATLHGSGVAAAEPGAEGLGGCPVSGVFVMSVRLHSRTAAYVVWNRISN